jgi:hypothetical protein
MKTLSVGLLFVLLSNSYAEEVITPKDRFIDSKTNKLLRICEVKNSELVVKEECGKYWESFPRKREELYKEVDTYKDFTKNELVLFPVKNKDGTTQIHFGQVANLYENGLMHVFQSESKKTGFSKGAEHYDFDYRYAIKLDKLHPLLAHAYLCAKEDTKIPYSYNEDHSYSVKKGEKVALKGIFENQTAVISLGSSWDNFWGYGNNNQLTVGLSQLEVCESDKESVSTDNTSRANNKAPNQDLVPIKGQKTNSMTK